MPTFLPEDSNDNPIPALRRRNPGNLPQFFLYLLHQRLLSANDGRDSVERDRR